MRQKAKVKEQRASSIFFQLFCVSFKKGGLPLAPAFPEVLLYCSSQIASNLLLFFLHCSRLRSSRQGGEVVDADDNEEMNIKMLRMSVPGEPGVVSNHLIVFQSSKLLQY